MTPTEELLLKVDKQWKRFLSEMMLARSIGLVWQGSVFSGEVMEVFRNAGPDAAIGCLCRFYLKGPEPQGEVPISIRVTIEGVVHWTHESMFFTESNRAALKELNKRLVQIGRDGARKVR